jgi:hypothetical protein
MRGGYQDTFLVVGKVVKPLFAYLTSVLFVVEYVLAGWAAA